MAKIFVTRRIPSSGLERLQTQFEVKVWERDDPPPREILLEQVRGCDALLTMLSDRVDGELMDAAGKQLRGIANFAVGYNNIDVTAATQRGIAVGNTPGALTDATADIAVALMLAAGRCFRTAIQNVDQLGWRNWEPMQFLGQEFGGKTLGIVGMGRIGAAVAKRLHFGWDMKVVYTSRSTKPEMEALFGARRVSLDDLLTESDVVSLHTSLQPETRGLIGERELRLMKQSAILINTSRGEVIHQTALNGALLNGTIFAAGLDVTDPEPLPSDSPLRQRENCVILPHIGSATHIARNRMSNIAAENIIAALSGRGMPYPVA
ncbi:MAG: D-glycerate dehydrogenase [Planctomycetota bacterium]